MPGMPTPARPAPIDALLMSVMKARMALTPARQAVVRVTICFLDAPRKEG